MVGGLSVIRVCSRIRDAFGNRQGEHDEPFDADRAIEACSSHRGFQLPMTSLHPSFFLSASSQDHLTLHINLVNPF